MVFPSEHWFAPNISIIISKQFSINKFSLIPNLSANPTVVVIFLPKPDENNEIHITKNQALEVSLFGNCSKPPILIKLQSTHFLDGKSKF